MGWTLAVNATCVVPSVLNVPHVLLCIGSLIYGLHYGQSAESHGEGKSYALLITSLMNIRVEYTMVASHGRLMYFRGGHRW